MNKLFFKISGVLFLLLAILAFAYMRISTYTAQSYLDELQQTLYGGLADSTVVHVKPLVDGKVDTAAIKDIMHSIMVINPSAEVYLLDTEGEIVTYMAPHKKIKLESVDLDPVLQYISPERPRCIKGDDPRHPGIQKIFSAAPIKNDGRLEGYLYVILASEEQEAIAAGLYDNYFFRLGATYFAGALLVALALGLIAIWYFTHHLRRISSTVTRFKEGDLTARIQNPDGDWKELSETFNSMADTINANIESMKSVEGLRRELVANISHDLRTPLSILKGYIETLQIKDDLTEEERQKYLDTAYASAEKLSSLISQLFEYSKLEAKQIEPSKEPFQVTDLLMDTVQKYELVAESKNIDLRIDSKAQVPLIFADISLVERVIQNIVDNALNYTPEGGAVVIHIASDKKDVRVSVSDTGPGIPEAEQALIFERYRKGDRRNRTGTGLGLAIAKKIMDLHQASIEVQSKLSEGSKFTLVFPAYG